MWKYSFSKYEEYIYYLDKLWNDPFAKNLGDRTTLMASEQSQGLLTEANHAWPVFRERIASLDLPKYISKELHDQPSSRDLSLLTLDDKRML